MNPLTAGESYFLRLPNGANLGQVRIDKLEDGWADGPFRPTAEFSGVRHLFEEEAHLRNDQIIPLWEKAADKIESLRIQVVSDRGDVHAGLRIFIEGSEAFLASPLEKT